MTDLTYLIESELERAEVILAAKSITNEIQKMAEQAAKIEVEDVMPLSDPIRELFGTTVAQQFADSVTEKLRELVANLTATKDAIADSIDRMQGGGSDLDTMGDEMEDLPAAAGEDLEDLDVPETDEVENFDDVPTDEIDFGEPLPDEGDAGVSKAAGREMKDAFESADLAVAREFMTMIREGSSATHAGKVLSETYGLAMSDIVAILEAAKGK